MIGGDRGVQRSLGRTASEVSHLFGLYVLSLFLLGAGFACGREVARPSREPLAEALAEVRAGEGRLVGAPWLKPLPEGSLPPLSHSVNSAVRVYARALEGEVTAENLRGEGVATLLAGEVNLAIADLSRAVEVDPKNASIWSDLAAAHLLRSKEASDPFELVLALSATNRAVQQDPNLLPAHFNRALALERLSLRDRALADWRYVTKHERDRRWLREAQSHAAKQAPPAIPATLKSRLSDIEAAVAQGRPDRIRTLVTGSVPTFREYLEETLLSEWAAAEREGRKGDAARRLESGTAIASAIVASGGDPMADDTIHQIREIRKEEPAKLHRLVAGFSAYFKGRELADHLFFSRALPQFQGAWKVLSRQHSPFAQWALYRIAVCHYQKDEYRLARAQVHLLPMGTPYQTVQGRSLLLLGLIDAIEGDPTGSITAYESAEAAFLKVREIPYAARLGGLKATSFEVLGKPHEAWDKLYPALTEPTLSGRPDILFLLYEQASWLARRQEETEIALWFQDEAVKNAQILGRPEAIVGVRREHAALLAALGRRIEARNELAETQPFLDQILDPRLRRSVRGDLLLAEGELATTKSPQEAIAKLNDAIPIFRDTHYYYRIGQALYERALAKIALGQQDAAEGDLAEAITESERQRDTISAAGDRISYLDRMKDLFDTMVGLQLGQRRPEVALRFSEQAKARVLWDWMLTRPAQGKSPPQLRSARSPALDLPSLQRVLPAGTAVIEYAVLPRKTVVWVLHRQGEVWSESLKVGAEALSDRIQRLRRALLNRNPGEVEAISKDLHEKLIRPLASHIAPGERLVLIPDGALHTLPFSLLRDRRTGRFLMQDHTCAVAPSARIFVASLRQDEELARRPERHVLVVAAPDFDPGIDPTLPALKAGATEATIAGLFPGSRVLEKSAARRDDFLMASRDFGMLYFGGHSMVNSDFPLLSRMLFAKDSGDPSRGVLYSGDILKQRFPRTRLVVLASCDTAAGRISRTEGVESLARPFLAAGVPSVIASLWQVDDQVTADFFVRFYRHLAGGFDVAGALQAAQVDALNSGDARAADPKAWAGFEVIGGGVTNSPPTVTASSSF
jgi:CHAT domain-containing protein/tetratricopeptide (TPR) repeat protein